MTRYLKSKNIGAGRFASAMICVILLISCLLMPSCAKDEQDGIEEGILTFTDALGNEVPRERSSFADL